MYIYNLYNIYARTMIPSRWFSLLGANELDAPNECLTLKPTLDYFCPHSFWSAKLFVHPPPDLNPPVNNVKYFIPTFPLDYINGENTGKGKLCLFMFICNSLTNMLCREVKWVCRFFSGYIVAVHASIQTDFEWDFLLCAIEYLLRWCQFL